MHTYTLKHTDVLMYTRVYALMWTHIHTHKHAHRGERIPCSFITVRPPWIEMTWQVLNVREVFFYYYTHTHTCTQPWMPAAGSPSRPHTLTHTHMPQTESLSRLLIPITHTHPQRCHMGSSVSVCGINGNTGGNCSKLCRHRINLDRETDTKRERGRVRHISAAINNFPSFF